MTMTFEITQRWDGRPSGHDPITVTLSTSHKSDDAITLEVNAPFFNDPGNPGGEPGKPFDKLWDYEGKWYFICIIIIGRGWGGGGKVIYSIRKLCRKGSSDGAEFVNK